MQDDYSVHGSKHIYDYFMKCSVGYCNVLTSSHVVFVWRAVCTYSLCLQWHSNSSISFIIILVCVTVCVMVFFEDSCFVMFLLSFKYLFFMSSHASLASDDIPFQLYSHVGFLHCIYIRMLYLTFFVSSLNRKLLFVMHCV